MRTESLEADRTEQNRIADLTREVELMEQQLETESRVVSPKAGQVLEVKVSAGSLVQVGTPIISLHPDVDTLEVVVYVPADKVWMAVRDVMVADGKPSLVMLRGDHQMSETKFQSATGATEFRQAHPFEIWVGAPDAPEPTIRANSIIVATGARFAQ